MTFHHSSALRNYLRHVAGWVWHEQDDALHYGLKLQEETLTEILLLRMARECSTAGLNVRMFNRIEEGGHKKTKKTGNGADWEWFVETPYCQVGFRVQAKVLSAPSKRARRMSDGVYKGLLKDKKQTNDLIRASKAGQFNPIYVFYNHPWVSDRALFAQLSSPFPISRTDWGCAVATANHVLHQTDNKLSSLISGMLPWHLFFGYDKGCMAQAAMSSMPGDQDFFSETPRPEWLYFMSDGPFAMDQYLAERDLSGVAHFKIED